MNDHQLGQIDVVIPIINGSKCNDIETLYCLRSIEAHISDYRNIVIVGHLPGFIDPTTVIHIPFKDGPNKQANIRDKILAAFSDSRTTDTIFFTNDDFFVLKPFRASNFPYFFLSDCSCASEKASKIAGKELKEQGLPSSWFDLHAPIVYKKDPFIEAMKHFSDESSIKSKYANFWHIKGEEITDLKINSSLRYERIMFELKDRPFFSVGDYGINQPMKRVLAELFPNPSKYELNQNKKAA